MRDITAAIRKAGSSTAQGLMGLPCSIFAFWESSYSWPFMTELFNLSVAGVDITKICKNSITILASPHHESRKAQRAKSLLPSISLLCQQRSWSSLSSDLLTIVTAFYHLSSSPHICLGGTWLLSVQHKSRSATNALTVDISKAFDTDSHSIHIGMIHHYRLWHNLVRWLLSSWSLRGPSAQNSYSKIIKKKLLLKINL